MSKGDILTLAEQVMIVNLDASPSRESGGGAGIRTPDTKIMILLL